MKAEIFILEVLWEDWVKRTSYRTLERAVYNAEPIVLVPARVRRYVLKLVASDGHTVWDPRDVVWQNELAS